MEKKQKKRGTWSWVFAFAGERKSWYIRSVILAFFGVLCAIGPYFLLADIVTAILSGESVLNQMLFDCAIMALLWIGKAVFHALSTSASHQATFYVLGNIRKLCLEKLSRISLGEVQKQSSGSLKNILVERIDSVETTLAHMLPEFTGNLAGSFLTFLFILIVDWRIALASVVTLVLAMIFFLLMMRGYEQNYGRTVRAVKGLNDAAVEYIGGIEVVKVFGKTKASYDRFSEAAREGAQSYIDWMKKCNIYHTFAMVIAPATLITVLPVGGILIRSGSLSPADFILTMILSLGLILPIINCLSFTDDISRLGTIMDEITGILEEKELPRPETDEQLPKGHTVVFHGVHFGYGESEVLHGIDLTFREGTVTALVGPSGSGKSTIAKLLMSYWDVDGGSITIGGIDIRRLSLSQYHRKIAYVSQNNYLFNDTIRENIRMGKPEATDAEIEDACKRCGCHDFIRGLEKGYDTLAGSSGTHLSGGERQRISIARAMLKDAPVVILDEATAYSDPENEAMLQGSIARLVKGKTLIVIAHRLSTIADADQIYVIDKGGVAEAGTHPVLLERKGLYSRMWAAHIASRDRTEGGTDHA